MHIHCLILSCNALKQKSKNLRGMKLRHLVKQDKVGKKWEIRWNSYQYNGPVCFNPKYNIYSFMFWFLYYIWEAERQERHSFHSLVHSLSVIAGIGLSQCQEMGIQPRSSTLAAGTPNTWAITCSRLTPHPSRNLELQNRERFCFFSPFLFFILFIFI